MPVWAVKFASVRLCRSIICGLLTIRTLMVWPSVAGFLVGPPPAVEAPLGAAIADGDDADAAPPVLAAALLAAELFAAVVEAELPHAAISSSVAQPATITLGLRCMVKSPFDWRERLCGGCRMRWVLSGEHE